MAFLEGEACRGLFAQPRRHAVEKLRDALAAVAVLRDALQQIGLAIVQRLGAHGVERGGIETQGRVEPAFEPGQLLPEDADNMLGLAAWPRHADAHLGPAVLRVEQHQREAARALAVSGKLSGDVTDEDACRFRQALQSGKRVGEFQARGINRLRHERRERFPLLPERLVEPAGDCLAQTRPEAGARDAGDLADGGQAQADEQGGTVRIDAQGFHRQGGKMAGLFLGPNDQAWGWGKPRQAPGRAGRPGHGRARGEAKAVQIMEDVAHQRVLAAEQMRKACRFDPQAVRLVGRGPGAEAVAGGSEPFQLQALGRAVMRRRGERGKHRAGVGEQHAGAQSGFPRGAIQRDQTFAALGLGDDSQRRRLMQLEPAAPPFEPVGLPEGQPYGNHPCHRTPSPSFAAANLPCVPR